MNISSINEVMPKVYEGIKEQGQKSFQDILKAAFDSANKMQNDYDEILKRQLVDESINIHDVVIAGEKAKLSLELTLQIRNKAIEAYQEIMRMQV
ncbi:MAG: flagellar hook-basal body complex protein FliE [Thermoanaerobacteraceae bacterium]|nr:flagellar hook-basal body complex protein FliE [Biomaibacter acetigenes]MDK2877469.1 flagellar hook-basal body complex protein FliE [Thermoanaerobacteraceae bacterium]MDN5312985.1 flagellar hook-basal body complex protein FliE [Thermoanaerobacteraceae bacterium]